MIGWYPPNFGYFDNDILFYNAWPSLSKISKWFELYDILSESDNYKIIKRSVTVKDVFMLNK